MSDLPYHNVTKIENYCSLPVVDEHTNCWPFWIICIENWHVIFTFHLTIQLEIHLEIQLSRAC